MWLFPDILRKNVNSCLKTKFVIGSFKKPNLTFAKIVVASPKMGAVKLVVVVSLTRKPLEYKFEDDIYPLEYQFELWSGE